MKMMQGVDDYSKVWHNDFDLKGEFNSNVLVYLDDSYNKNAIEITNGTETFTVHHKKGDVVWLNQRKSFKHRATHTHGTRRLMAFEFYIDDLWT